MSPRGIIKRLQYNNSMRTGTSITWSGSPADIKYDKSTGKITMLKNAAGDQAWTYSDKIYITGVYTKTGTVCQAELSVGVEQALDTIEIAGFVKAGTTEILDYLPADFKTSTYYLVYKVLDQNGDEMKVTNNAFPVVGTDVTFISDNILLVKELTDPATVGQNTTMSIDGLEYARVLVSPGMKVSEGGEANITAIANKTGNKTIKNIAVGEGVVLDSFELLAPTGTIADGESIEIPFIAKDTNGYDITNFVNIAKQKTFNTLSFNTSSGALVLSEQDNGTAKLTFYDFGAGVPDWTDDNSTDGIDRKVSLTAIVTGGGTSNEMIDIADKARPVAIKAVNLKDVFLEGAKLASFTLDSFQYIDQYDRVIKGTDKTETWGDSTEFFENFDDAETSKGSSDFKGHVYGVRTSYSGNGNIVADATGAPLNTTDDPKILTYTAVAAGDAPVANIGTHVPTIDTFDLYAGTEVDSAKTGENLKFEIVKADAKSTAWDAVSTALNKTLTIVDISKVSGFEIKDLNTFYVGPVEGAIDGDAVTGKGILDVTGMTDDPGTIDFDQAIDVTGTTEGLTEDTDYQQSVSVIGYYNGKEVSVPKNYYTVTGKKLGTNADATAIDKNDNTIDALVATGGAINITLGDLYDKTTARYNSKLGTDKLTATIYNIDTFNAGNIAGLATDYGDVKDTATKDVTFSDQEPSAAKFVGLKDEYTADPIATALEQAAGVWTDTTDDGETDTRIGGIIGKNRANNKDDLTGSWHVVDQYGVFIEPSDATFRITNIVENPDGWAENNFKVSGNGTSDVVIVGAERGDTFDIVISYKGLEATATVTVGADENAMIWNDTNVWQENLIGDEDDGLLETQRLNGLS